MNHYEEKIQMKKERYAELAGKKTAEAENLYSAARAMSEMIPFGQPILVGHHSEKGHRRLLDKIHNKYGKAMETQETADYYANKAESIGTGGISSDDPDAIEKLANKLSMLVDRQKDMRKHNAEARAHKLPQPYAAYQLSNNNAVIRSVKIRIAQLTSRREMSVNLDVSGAGWRLHEEKDENRIQFIFDGKPSEAVRTLLKSHGFRWSPTSGAWQTFLTNRGRYQAKNVISKLENTL